MQVSTKIYLLKYYNIFLAGYKYSYLLCDMAKRKAGRPTSEDKRKPFNFRIKTSVLDALKERSKEEQRAMNTIAENILEKALL